MAEKPASKVAVIGLGSCGLVTLKNLREAGFDATGYESNNYVGGLWEHTEEPDKTSVLKTTVANLSKQLSCYTDYAYPDDVPNYATAAQTAQYLRDYAQHFGLLQHAKLGMKLSKAERHDDGWLLKMIQLSTKEEQQIHVDKVVMCVGLQVQTPKLPTIKGLETFTGQATHSNNYKLGSTFTGKRVVVVGLGNTGCDTAVDLTNHTSTVWLSHRKGAAFFSRTNAKTGKPGDHMMSVRLTMLAGIFNKYLPGLAQKMSLLGIKAVQKRTFDVKAEWNLGEILPPTRKVPVANDKFVPALHEGKIDLRPALQEVNGSTLTFSDGSTLTDIDAIIFATGFRSDYSYMSPSVDPTRDPPKEWSSLPGFDSRPLPRLYQGIFSLDHPTSLAFLGTSPFSFMACLNYDISSLAVAQVWTGNSSLPSPAEMSAHVDAQHASILEIARTGELANVNLRNNWEWFKWCDDVAGLGVAKRVGYGVEGWKFWLRDRRMCKLVMDGLLSPHMFRLFDEGKRKAWEGARGEVVRVNDMARRG
ncbi:hypothetical protein M409DRAFT_68710 [Zasmidium cellare ATCC 36951]|uniref:FAD/NAD(P)-binding domain-containing protein n=1 Tax=Zasmidium cellare ATCC 36951 TaxID=1080233 RepID=A0A6A6CA10_ZASCE|nr:uncharacterized protein M409DRAFT_68710 [Zasmidium cellare ATCC 36951]KAF2163078.1 hypothetical protein M409DRAFT_68710 [Zasmidium cellare ATCC 36951]